MINIPEDNFIIEEMMKNRILNIFSFSLILGYIFTLSLSDLSFAQQFNKINNVPGGGSGNANQTIESNDNTLLYVAGMAVVAGIVVYALLKEKKADTKRDTTATISSNYNYLKQNLTLTEKILEVQSEIPINISLGIQLEKPFIDGRRYFIGLNYSF